MSPPKIAAHAITTMSGADTDVTQKCTGTDAEFWMPNHSSNTAAAPMAISDGSILRFGVSTGFSLIVTSGPKDKCR